MRPRTAFRPALEQLEHRQLLATAPLVSAMFPTLQPTAHHGPVQHTPVSANVQALLSFLHAHVGARIGGGECGHLASEALRVGGFNIILPRPSPGPTDYVWGQLIKVLHAGPNGSTDSNPASAIHLGDVLQFHNAVWQTQTGTHMALQHTAIVAAVNSQGLPTKVYEQNVGFNGGPAQRFDHFDPIDLSHIQQGWVRVYRPTPRPSASDYYQFSIVNNTAAPQQATLSIGGHAVGTAPFTAANTANSYATYSLTGTGQPTITINHITTPISNGGGYEIYAGPSGPAIRALNP